MFAGTNFNKDLTPWIKKLNYNSGLVKNIEKYIK
jgi:hypothetical protein